VQPNGDVLTGIQSDTYKTVVAEVSTVCDDTLATARRIVGHVKLFWSDHCLSSSGANWVD